MAGIGIALRGIGKALKVGKKAKPKKPHYYIKEENKPYIKQFKKSKKHGLAKKLDVWANRESGKLFSQAGSGVNIKYTKAGKPYVPKGTKPSMLTKAKGWAKLTAPIAAAATAGAVHGKSKGKK